VDIITDIERYRGLLQVMDKNGTRTDVKRRDAFNTYVDMLNVLAEKRIKISFFLIMRKMQHQSAFF
jgi:hypothetical protein